MREKEPQKTRKAREQQNSNAVRNPVPAEGNFEELPYFKVGDRNSGMGVMEYNGVIRTRDGHILNQKWVVRASQGMGLPGRLDQDVYVAILQLIDRRGGIPANGELEFSIYELVELLGGTHGGMTYKRIKESLRRMALTGIESVNAFYHKKSQSYISDTFQLWSVHFADHDDGRGKHVERHRLRFSKFFVDSYRSNYLKGLDVDFYWLLRSPVAKRLYRLIDKKRNHRRRWEVEIFSLRDRVALSSEYRYPSRIKDKLTPAHNELIQKGFLEEVSFHKNDAGDLYVSYVISEHFAGRAREREDLASLNSHERLSVERLRTEGLNAKAATDLVMRYGPQRCLYYAEALPFQKNVRNPGGWLRWAIETGPELDMPTPVSLNAIHGNGGGEATRKLPRILDPDPSASKAWEALKQDFIESNNTSDNSLLWFEGFIPIELNGSTLTIVVPNENAASYIEERYGEALLRTWIVHADAEAQIKFIPRAVYS